MIRRVLIAQDYKQYAPCLAKFFHIQPQRGETLALDGKVLRGSYQLEQDNLDFCLSPVSSTVFRQIIAEQKLRYFVFTLIY